MPEWVQKAIADVTPIANEAVAIETFLSHLGLQLKGATDLAAKLSSVAAEVSPFAGIIADAIKAKG